MVKETESFRAVQNAQEASGDLSSDLLSMDLMISSSQSKRRTLCRQNRPMLSENNAGPTAILPILELHDNESKLENKSAPGNDTTERQHTNTRQESDVFGKVLQLPPALAHDKFIKTQMPSTEAQTAPFPLLVIDGVDGVAAVGDAHATEKTNKLATGAKQSELIGKLIDQLDSDEFKERNDAQSQLTKMGPKALSTIADRLAEQKKDTQLSFEQKDRLGKTVKTIMDGSNIHSNKDLLNDSLKLGNKNLINLIANSANAFARNPDKAISDMFNVVHQKDTQMPAKLWQSVADTLERTDDSFTKWARAAAKLEDAPKSVKDIVAKLDGDQAPKHYGKYRDALGKLTSSEIHQLIAENSGKVTDRGELKAADRNAARQKSAKLFEDVVNAKGPLPFNHPSFHHVMGNYLKNTDIKTSDLSKTISRLQDQMKKGLGAGETDLQNNFTFTALYAFEHGMNRQSGDNQKLLKSAFQDTFKRLEKHIDSLPPEDQEYPLSNLLKAAQRTNDKAAQERIQAKLK